MKVVKSRSLICLGVCIVLSSCGGYTTGTVQKAGRAYLKFVGNTNSTYAMIDDGDLFPILVPDDPGASTDYLFEVVPGTRRVRVVRDDRVVVDRKVFVDNHVTMEIIIP